MNLQVLFKKYKQKGNLVYEYNPIRNLRFDEDMYYYHNGLYSKEELEKNFGIEISGSEFLLNKSLMTEDIPVLYLAGLLCDFDTDKLLFDIEHPVDILPQWSYDNSVNLIINDGKNKPKLINTRFSPLNANEYLIVDRKGNNDTNIYDAGDLFELQTSLYKNTIKIPRLDLIGVFYGGNLKIGNYHFYFKYLDEDGNATDFIAESGMVSIFKGNTPQSIVSGFRNENSHKMIKFKLRNVDSAYNNVLIYYTRATSEVNLDISINAYKIDLNFKFSTSSLDISITGFENVIEVSTAEINPSYLIYDSVKSQASTNDMLFLANVTKDLSDSEDLLDISLYFKPTLVAENYPLSISHTYNITSSSMGYYDPTYIYNKTGYWNHEMYRFGIVYILNNNQLSRVFNVRGTYNLTSNYDWLKIGIDNSDEDSIKEDRTKISYNENTFLINDTSENVKGVVKIDYDQGNGTLQKVLSINFTVNKKVLDYLKLKQIKGFFFVRLKRIPTILCLAYTIAIDPQSKTPILPIKGGYITESFLSNGKGITKAKTLTHDLGDRIYTIEDENHDNSLIRKQAAICPDYDVNFSDLNSMFCGNECVVEDADMLPEDILIRDNNHFYISNYKSNNDRNITTCNIIGVEDNTKLIAIGDNMFSARAGEAEEAFRYEYIFSKVITKDSTNLLRGSYGPYLGITNYDKINKLINIRIPGYNEGNISDYFKIRYTDKSSFYAISDRIDLQNIDDWYDGSTFYKSFYRGDCFICLFTHRLNRNFQDPTFPLNDDIVDPETWLDNFDAKDGVVKKEKFDKINLGDVNAVKLGLWVTFTVRSSMNLNIRAEDNSYPEEWALSGHPRNFYPNCAMNNDGVLKIPEALCFNQGFAKTVSEKYNTESLDYPAIKNDFSNRIAYSDICITDAFINGFRTFQGRHYLDYPKTYGAITKIVEANSSLICVCEHGILLLPVNERALVGEGQGGNLYINTSNVLPDTPTVISDKYGSQWKDSIVKTPKGVYGVDPIAKKIWLTNGQSIQIISDRAVQEFLNNNITLTETETTPIIGIRNIKTHYNAFKGDVMFTYYDNLYGHVEKVWNLCFNEDLGKFTTFYSWVPSYSENIGNLFFTFDRNTSKYISKLAVSKKYSLFADGITLDNNIIDSLDEVKNISLSISNRDIDGYYVTYEILPDNFGNYLYFDIVKDENEYKLKLKEKNGEAIINPDNYVVKLYCKADENGNKLEPLDSGYDTATEYYYDENLRKVYALQPINDDKIVIYLNIKANLYSNADTSNEANLIANSNNAYTGSSGYYESTVAIILKDNMLYLSTAFWKHGFAGNLDIAEEIEPTKWYGKQHPFEFEFVVASNPQLHKIFDNLQIISNKAEPESFHYEIVGECYDFAKDKKNMYIRQEATKKLYFYNGMDVDYDTGYINLKEEHRPITIGDTSGKFDRSTLFPLYYSRRDSVNNIEDYYHMKDGGNTKNYSALAGAEIVRYKNLDEYRICNHAKAVDIVSNGRMRGNMLYKEDRWDILINPINLIYKNEPKWSKNSLVNNSASDDKIPIEINQSPIPDSIITETNSINLNGLDKGRGIVAWKWEESMNLEVKVKDKFVKIRIRYKGDKLAVINAVTTLFSISYS